MISAPTTSAVESRCARSRLLARSTATRLPPQPMPERLKLRVLLRSPYRSMIIAERDGAGEKMLHATTTASMPPGSRPVFSRRSSMAEKIAIRASARDASRDGRCGKERKAGGT
ncbi:uncharacterized protein M6B38_272280 [Iris pallida]|uniref:Uncharacterized protein n=1 Tax=Iris pallida TaxID=29817 RepID=A0AAX6I620_IRIPA|nr:uncharacterized protein M6B38_272280 [Iris pallida]